MCKIGCSFSPSFFVTCVFQGYANLRNQLIESYLIYHCYTAHFEMSFEIAHLNDLSCYFSYVTDFDNCVTSTNAASGYSILIRALVYS